MFWIIQQLLAYVHVTDRSDGLLLVITCWMKGGFVKRTTVEIELFTTFVITHIQLGLIPLRPTAMVEYWWSLWTVYDCRILIPHPMTTKCSEVIASTTCQTFFGYHRAIGDFPIQGASLQVRLTLRHKQLENNKNNNINLTLLRIFKVSSFVFHSWLSPEAFNRFRLSIMT